MSIINREEEHNKDSKINVEVESEVNEIYIKTKVYH